MTAQTISEKILSAHCGHPVRAGEIAVCRVDCVIGTDGSGPMAIDYVLPVNFGAGRLVLSITWV